MLLRAAIQHHCATCGADAAAICAVVDYEIGRVAGPAHRAWKAVMLQRRCDRIASAADDEALEGARQSAASCRLIGTACRNTTRHSLMSHTRRSLVRDPVSCRSPRDYQNYSGLPLSTGKSDSPTYFIQEN